VTTTIESIIYYQTKSSPIPSATISIEDIVVQTHMLHETTTKSIDAVPSSKFSIEVIALYETKTSQATSISAEVDTIEIVKLYETVQQSYVPTQTDQAHTSILYETAISDMLEPGATAIISNTLLLESERSKAPKTISEHVPQETTSLYQTIVHQSQIMPMVPVSQTIVLSTSRTIFSSLSSTIPNPRETTVLLQTTSTSLETGVESTPVATIVLFETTSSKLDSEILPDPTVSTDSVPFESPVVVSVDTTTLAQTTSIATTTLAEISNAGPSQIPVTTVETTILAETLSSVPLESLVVESVDTTTLAQTASVSASGPFATDSVETMTFAETEVSTPVPSEKPSTTYNTLIFETSREKLSSVSDSFIITTTTVYETATSRIDLASATASVLNSILFETGIIRSTSQSEYITPSTTTVVYDTAILSISSSSTPPSSSTTVFFESKSTEISSQMTTKTIHESSVVFETAQVSIDKELYQAAPETTMLYQTSLVSSSKAPFDFATETTVLYETASSTIVLFSSALVTKNTLLLETKRLTQTLQTSVPTSVVTSMHQETAETSKHQTVSPTAHSAAFYETTTTQVEIEELSTSTPSTAIFSSEVTLVLESVNYHETTTTNLVMTSLSRPETTTLGETITSDLTSPIVHFTVTINTILSQTDKVALTSTVDSLSIQTTIWHQTDTREKTLSFPTISANSVLYDTTRSKLPAPVPEQTLVVTSSMLQTQTTQLTYAKDSISSLTVTTPTITVESVVVYESESVQEYSPPATSVEKTSIAETATSTLRSYEDSILVTSSSLYQTVSNEQSSQSEAPTRIDSTVVYQQTSTSIISPEYTSMYTTTMVDASTSTREPPIPTSVISIELIDISTRIIPATPWTTPINTRTNVQPQTSRIITSVVATPTPPFSIERDFRQPVTSTVVVLTVEPTTRTIVTTASPTPTPSVSCPDKAQTFYPKCGKCFFKSPIDCMGECNMYEVDCGGNCVLRGQGLGRDCEGNCLRSTDSRFKRRDACRVCGGDNSTCTDCRGVLFGKAKRDNCKVCEGNNTACFTITSLFPQMVRNTASNKIQIRGARLPPQSIMFNNVEWVSSINSSTAQSNFAEFTISGVDLGGDPYRTFTMNISGFDPEQGILSFPFNITLFDSDIKLNSMSDNTVMVGSSLRMEITGTKLFGFSPARCAWVDGRDVSLTELTLYNSSAGWCPTPVKLVSRTVGSQLNILYGWDVDVSLFIPRDEQNEFLLMYYEYAPVLISSNFSFTGSEINVFFDKAVQYNPSRTMDLTKRNLCNLFISQSSTDNKQFWNTPADCNVIFPNPLAMTIMIAPRYIRVNIDIIPTLNDMVVILNNTFGSRGAFYSLTSSGSAIIDAPTTAIVPLINVRAPRILDECPDLTFDLSKTSGRGGRPFFAGTFSVITSFDSTNVTAASRLNTKLEEAKNLILTNKNANVNPFEFTIASSLLPDGTYTFTFQLINFLLQEGTISYSITKSSLLHIPMILYDPPGVLQADVDNLIGPKVSYPCGDKYGIVISNWVSIDGLYTINPAAAARRKLTFEPYSLQPNSVYNFVLMTYYESFKNEVYNYTFTVTTSPREIAVDIGLGLTVSETGSIRIKAEIKDSGASAGEIKRSISKYTFDWFCVTTDFNDCYNTTSNLPLELENAQKLEFANVLTPDTYLFFVTVSTTFQGSIISGTSPRVPITISEEDFPTVSVVSTESNPGVFTNFALLSFVGNTGVGATLTYLWTSEETCDGLPYTTIDLNNGANVLAKVKSLKFVPGALSAGSKYCFALTVYDSTKNTPGYAFATIGVKKRPSSGYCDVVGDHSGTEFSTAFKLVCSGWETDLTSYPLKYSWEMAKTGSESYGIIYPLSDLPVVNLLLPSGNYTIRARIVDAEGSENEEDQLIALEVKASSDPDAAKTFADSSLADFEKSGDYAAALSNMASVGSSLVSSTNKKKKRDEAEDLKKKAVNFISGLVDSGTVYLGPSGASSSLLSTLNKLANTNVTIPSQLQGLMFDFLTMLVNKVSANTADKGQCFGDEDAGIVIGVLDVMIRSSQSLRNETVVGKLFDVTSEIQKCILRTLACGQVPFSSDSVAVKRSAGVIDPTLETSACGFNFADLKGIFSGQTSSFDENGCVQFTCGETRSSVYVENQNNTVSPIVNDLSFVNTNVSNAKAITFSISIDADFAKEYNLTTYNLAMPDSNSWDDHRVKPACAYYTGQLGQDNNAGNWTTDGCEAIALNSTHLTCRCTHLTSFGVKVVRVIEPPKTTTVATGTGTGTTKPTATETSEPKQEGAGSGATIGAVAGVVVVAAVLAVVGYRKHKSKKAAKKDEGQMVLPPGVIKDLDEKNKDAEESKASSEENLGSTRSKGSGDIGEEQEEEQVEEEEEQGEEAKEEEPEIVTAGQTTTTKKAILPPIDPQAIKLQRTLANLPPYALPPSYAEHILAIGNATRKDARLGPLEHGSQEETDSGERRQSFDTINTEEGD
jgi:hypothetical protein